MSEDTELIAGQGSDGKIVLPRTLSWLAAFGVVGVMLGGLIFALDLKTATTGNTAEIETLKTDVGVLKDTRAKDSERLARVEEQTKVGVDLMRRVLDKLDRIEERR